VQCTPRPTRRLGLYAAGTPFRAEHPRRPTQGLQPPAPIDNPAGRDHRDRYGADDLRHESYEPNQPIVEGAHECAAVPPARTVASAVQLNLR
jgi:hypothetical protein